MKRALRLAAGATALLVLAAAACSADEHIATSKIFAAVPWQDGERLVYRVTDRGVNGVGTCTLEADAGSEPGRTNLVRRCENGQYRDDGSALVDSTTLAPISSERTAIDGKNNRSSTFTVAYEETIARFEANVNGAVRETTRDLPTPDAQSPHPGWYDDESLLWLARGIPLEDGWQGGYWHVINAGQPRVLAVQVRVEHQEDITVPAGRFSAWRVRFQREDTIYFVWIDSQAPYRVVQAQIEDVKYELTGTG